MTAPLYTPLAASLPSTVPFVGPETQERSLGQRFRARLGANESLFGPSPRAIAAMAAAAAEVWMYGDPELYDLKAALASHHGCGPDHIVVGEGIDGLLGYLVRLMIGPGDKVVTSLGASPTFTFPVAGFGGEIIRVPYKADHEDPDALIAAAWAHRPKLVLMIAGVSLWVLGVITAGVWLWAFAYLWIGAFGTLEEAVYFSLVCFTTLGFGDVLLPQDWRILAGMTAANGFLNFGLLTALLIEALRQIRLGQVERRKSR
jgi:hypothetical protein